MAASTADYELVDPPTDGISSIEFCPDNGSLLLAASWDKGVRLYNVQSNQRSFTYYHKAAVLDVAFVSPTQAYSGGLDRELKGVDLQETKETVLGSHDDGIKCVHYAKETGTVISGSWDKSVRMWDPRAATAEVGRHQQPAKVFAMDLVREKLVVAMAGRSVMIYDIRNMKEALQQRESSLKFMTRTVKCMPNGDGALLVWVEH
ncbi:mitotic spindle checkpoint protein Bub3 [Irineochytrium annulatum]|nr:mitotic spindle checkpoint protein Bub3 [Irineochytrium annulatum]